MPPPRSNVWCGHPCCPTCRTNGLVPDGPGVPPSWCGDNECRRCLDANLVPMDLRNEVGGETTVPTAPPRHPRHNCYYCGVTRSEPNMHQHAINGNMKWWCNACYERVFVACDVCHNLTPRYEIMRYNVFDVATQELGTPPIVSCHQCYITTYNQCRGCNNTVLRTSGQMIDPHGWYCSYCESRNFATCAYCDQLFPMWTRDGGRIRDCCQSCYQERRQAIRNHSFTPSRLKFLKLDSQDKEQLFFGFEVETENVHGRVRNEDAARSVNNTGLLYCKLDGSIMNGFEVVSHPFTYEWFRKHIADFTPLFKLADDGFKSFQTETCGMHVHMSKDAFIHSHLFKYLKFFYGCPDFVLLVSRRKRDRLNQWANPIFNRNEVGASMTQVAREKFMHGKYRAVNLSPERTVEVRIFRGTLAKHGISRNIEVCKSIYDFTKRASMKEAGKLNDYLSFMSEKEAQRAFPNLHDFLTAQRRANNGKVVA